MISNLVDSSDLFFLVEQETYTPLMYAAMAGHSEIVRTLLRWGAEAHRINKVSCHIGCFFFHFQI